VSFQELKDT
jgi:Protein of unknown function (DUF2009)